MRVFKYSLDVNQYIFGSKLISMPGNAQALSVGLQEDNLVVWALVDPSNIDQMKEFIVVPTGHTQINDSHLLRFIGTVQYESGIVAHVFENIL